MDPPTGRDMRNAHGKMPDQRQVGVTESGLFVQRAFMPHGVFHFQDGGTCIKSLVRVRRSRTGMNGLDRAGA